MTKKVVAAAVYDDCCLQFLVFLAGKEKVSQKIECNEIKCGLAIVFFFADSRLTRKTPASYADGVYMLAGQDRPSPRKLSQVKIKKNKVITNCRKILIFVFQAFMRGSDGLGSKRNRTALLAFFGQVRQTISHKNMCTFILKNISQVVTAEILMASEGGCPIEIHRIPIDTCDEMFDPGKTKNSVEKIYKIRLWNQFAFPRAISRLPRRPPHALLPRPLRPGDGTESKQAEGAGEIETLDWISLIKVFPKCISLHFFTLSSIA